MNSQGLTKFINFQCQIQFKIMFMVPGIKADYYEDWILTIMVKLTTQQYTPYNNIYETKPLEILALN